MRLRHSSHWLLAVALLTQTAGLAQYAHDHLEHSDHHNHAGHTDPSSSHDIQDECLQCLALLHTAATPNDLPVNWLFQYQLTHGLESPRQHYTESSPLHLHSGRAPPNII